MEEKPVDFEDFLVKMRSRGYSIKRGKHIAFRSEEMGKNIRLRSLGEEFSEENLRAIIGGSAKLKQPKPSKPRKNLENKKDESISLLIDIDKALNEKGVGYQRWAKKFNLKQMAKTVNYLTENNLMDYNKLREKASGIPERLEDITAEIKLKESRLSEISTIQENIIHYAKTKEIYNDYHKSGYSPKFKEEHITDIILHETSRDFFKKEGYKTFPKMKELTQEYKKLKREKDDLYKEYYSIKKENKDILNAKANIEILLDIKKENEKDLKNRGTRS